MIALTTCSQILAKLTGCFGVINFWFSAELKVNIEMFNFLFPADQNFCECNWFYSWLQARFKNLKSTVSCIIGKKGHSCPRTINQHHKCIEREISADLCVIPKSRHFMENGIIVSYLMLTPFSPFFWIQYWLQFFAFGVLAKSRICPSTNSYSM